MKHKLKGEAKERYASLIEQGFSASLAKKLCRNEANEKRIAAWKGAHKHGRELAAVGITPENGTPRIPDAPANHITNAASMQEATTVVENPLQFPSAQFDNIRHDDGESIGKNLPSTLPSASQKITPRKNNAVLLRARCVEKPQAGFDFDPTTMFELKFQSVVNAFKEDGVEPKIDGCVFEEEHVVFHARDEATVNWIITNSNKLQEARITVIIINENLEAKVVGNSIPTPVPNSKTVEEAMINLGIVPVGYPKVVLSEKQQKIIEERLTEMVEFSYRDGDDFRAIEKILSFREGFLAVVCRTRETERWLKEKLDMLQIPQVKIEIVELRDLPFTTTTTTDEKAAKITKKNIAAPCEIKLGIVPTKFPYVELSPAQQSFIESKLLELSRCCRDKYVQPEFGKTEFYQGFLVVTCLNKPTVKWVKRYVSLLQIPNMEVMIVSEDNIPGPLNVAGDFQASSSETLDRILDFIQSQNGRLKCDLWQLVNRLDKDDGYSQIVFTVSPACFVVLEATGFEIYYKFSKITLRTFGKVAGQTSVFSGPKLDNRPICRPSYDEDDSDLNLPETPDIAMLKSAIGRFQPPVIPKLMEVRPRLVSKPSGFSAAKHQHSMLVSQQEPVGPPISFSIGEPYKISKPLPTEAKLYSAEDVSEEPPVTSSGSAPPVHQFLPLPLPVPPPCAFLPGPMPFQGTPYLPNPFIAQSAGQLPHPLIRSESSHVNALLAGQIPAPRFMEHRQFR